MMAVLTVRKQNKHCFRVYFGYYTLQSLYDKTKVFSKKQNFHVVVLSSRLQQKSKPEAECNFIRK